MNRVDVQIVCQSASMPASRQLAAWAENILKSRIEDFEMVVRIVDQPESARLNERFRSRKGPTNVLSFCCDRLEGIPLNILGDVVICAPVVEQEAREQGKSIEAHWAHMIVHGVLHLLGYDHIEGLKAAEMEAEESKLLSKFGFPDPYDEVVA